MKFRNALISVSDKTGLLDFIKPLAQEGTRLVSTGGTAQLLRKAGLKVVDVSEQTGFPEVMDGRVKTLHPNIHMALLARDHVSTDRDLLAQYGLESFDLVVGNLYPFTEGLKKNLGLEEQIELIDIGGPSFLRSAAKSFDRITVLCDPADYSAVLNARPTLEDRKRFAAKVFAHTSLYDSIVSEYLSDGQVLPEHSLSGKLQLTLRYGENPQQKGLWYASPQAQNGLHQAKLIQGKELSYNNILDLDAAVQTLREFDFATCVAVKHNNPCGIATDPNPERAVEKAIQSDPVSVFGGIVAVNTTLTEDAARRLCDLFLECVVAPAYSPQALEIFAKKKNVRVLEWPHLLEKSQTHNVKTIDGGFLLQDVDQVGSWSDQWRVIGPQVSQHERADYLFAWRACARLKSNAIAIVGEGQTLGLGMGQVNRIDAVEQAITRWQKFHPDKKNVVLASDAFFPFADSIQLAHSAGVKKVIQPGGSIKDPEVIAMAEKLGVQMVLTGQRHFLH